MVRRLLMGLGAVLVMAACGGGNTNNAVGNNGGGGNPAPTTSSSSSNSVDFRETEYTLAPDKVTLKPGTYTFNVTNVGQFPHDLHVAASADGTEVGGSTVVAAGKTVSFTITLQAGQYTTWCAVDAHRSLGMQGTITVQ
jgi:plastocyanin